MSPSSFHHIIGNDANKKHLARMVERERVPQSLLFSGSEGIGKGIFAQAFAKLIVGTENEHHSDIRHYYPEGKVGMHSVDSLRQFNEAVYMAPFEAKKKVFIIHDADRMLSYSANALLKTFEEPALDSVIILLSSSPDEIWQTVLSRCQKIRFQPLSKEDICQFLVQQKSVAADKAEAVSLRSRGSIGRALKLLDDSGESMRCALLDSLAKGSISYYPHILDLKKEIFKGINDTVVEEGEALRAQLMAEFTDTPTAIQKNVIEQEVDGFVALRRSTGGHEIFDIVLSWFRDIYLIKFGGDQKLLMNPDYSDSLAKAAQAEKIPTLETIQKHVIEVKTLLRRSSGLEYCLENLFLRISC